MKKFLASNTISGVKASGQTITYNLVHPASYFSAMLTMDPFYPAPVESLNYVPASSAAAQHTIADGPYQVQSYTPARSMTLVRNPAWKASSDPIHKAYVDKIVISMTGNQTAIQQQLQTNTAAASMEFDAFPPVGATPGLVKQMESGLTKNMNLGPTFSPTRTWSPKPVSPNNNKALQVAVRQALSYGINRSPRHRRRWQFSPPLTHIPLTASTGPDVPGVTTRTRTTRPRPSKCWRPPGTRTGFVTPALPPEAPSYQDGPTLQADLPKIGVKVKLLQPALGFYEIRQVPSSPSAGVGSPVC
jgi:peptide/nickel transport system substrate-binding protein